MHLTPQWDEENGMYRYGYSGGGYVKTGFFETIKYSGYVVEYWITSTLESLKMLITGQVGMDSMSGPVGIVDVVQDTYNQSKSGGAALVFLNMLNLMILLSAIWSDESASDPGAGRRTSGVLIIEVIRGKRVPPEKEGYVHMIEWSVCSC